MSTVWKFPLAVTDRQSITMPAGSTVLAVDVQYGQPCLWVQVEPKAHHVSRTFFIHGTGHKIDPEAGQHVGTFLIEGGSLVFHVFEARP